MGLINVIALIIIVGGGLFLNWQDLEKAQWRFKWRGRRAWKRGKDNVKSAWYGCDWCRRVWTYSKENIALAFTYTLFVAAILLFGLLFYWWVYPFIKILYSAIEPQIKNIKIGSRAFRNVSLSIAGSITLSIALLGMILTVIRNLLTRQQNRIEEERLATEQISRAIDQIGSYKQDSKNDKLQPNIEVRLGGLYSLQRIMKNSPKDEETLARIFYAYMHENAEKITPKKG